MEGANRFVTFVGSETPLSVEPLILRAFPASPLSVLKPSYIREIHADGVNGYTIAYDSTSGAVTASGSCTVS